MSLQTDNRHLNELLQDFYTLTGIKIALFDDNFKEILRHPSNHSELCKIIRRERTRNECCEASDRRSFAECKQSGKLVIYKCHAGLIEATAPIKANGIIIAYLMFGQISDCRDREWLTHDLLHRFNVSADDTDNWQKAIREIKIKNSQQIQAAAKVLEALTYYFMHKDLLTLRHERLADKLNAYVDDNIKAPMTTDQLASHFHISRTRLYELTCQDLGMGIARFILMKRLEKAKVLLTTTPRSIARISDEVGFADPAYFARVFRNEYKLSPSEYRARYGDVIYT